MSVDLYAEVFSVDLFRFLWQKCSLIPVVLPRIKKYCCKSIDNDSLQIVVHAVICRWKIFRQKILVCLQDHDVKKFAQSGVDFYLFLLNNVKNVMPCAEMNIFEKVFLSCAFVVEMGFCCNEENFKMYSYCAPLCWAMYFDSQMKTEFYFDGGFETLILHANTYKMSRVLCDYSQPNTESIFFPNDLINIQLLIADLTTDYNIDEVIYHFVKISAKQKSRKKLCCPQCEPIFATLKFLSMHTNMDIDDHVLVEGHLQIILHAHSTVEFSQIYQNAEQQFQTETGESFKFVTDSEPQTKSFSKYLKSKATLELISRIFKHNNSSDSNNYELHNVLSKQISDLDNCIFCSRSCLGHIVFLGTDGLFEAADRIKMVISKTLKAKSKNPDLFKGNNLSSLSEATPASLCSSESGNRTGAIPKMGNTDADETVKYFSEEDALRMFQVLGANNLQTPKHQENAQVTSESKSNLVQEDQIGKAKSKSKKKKNKKKKKVST